MPLYEYRCLKCGHRFEEIRRFSDPPGANCPKCSGKAEKLISAPAFHFKGSGWYVTDYAKKNGSPAPSGSSDSGSSDAGSKDSGSKDSGSKESAPAAPAASEKKDKKDKKGSSSGD